MQSSQAYGVSHHAFDHKYQENQDICDVLNDLDCSGIRNVLKHLSYPSVHCVLQYLHDAIISRFIKHLDLSSICSVLFMFCCCPFTVDLPFYPLLAPTPWPATPKSIPPLPINVHESSIHVPYLPIPLLSCFVPSAHCHSVLYSVSLVLCGSSVCFVD